MGEFNVNKTTGGLNPTAGMPETYPAEQVMMPDGVTSVEEAVDEVASSVETIVASNGTASVTGVSGDWVYLNITFATPFRKQPLVTVNLYDTGSGNNWYPPMLKDITTTGFKAGWYNASGTRQIVWQAIGVR